jgi:hypothetical protein
VTHIVDADNERKDGPSVSSGVLWPISLVLLQVIEHKMQKENGFLISLLARHYFL